MALAQGLWNQATMGDAKNLEFQTVVVAVMVSVLQKLSATEATAAPQLTTEEEEVLRDQADGAMSRTLLRTTWNVCMAAKAEAKGCGAFQPHLPDKCRISTRGLRCSTVECGVETCEVQTRGFRPRALVAGRLEASTREVEEVEEASATCLSQGALHLHLMDRRLLTKADAFLEEGQQLNLRKITGVVVWMS